MHGDGAVRVWRADVGGGAICMHGTTSSYAVDPIGEHVVGMVLAGGMRVRRGHEVHRFGPGDVCAWDPSARREGRPWRSPHWEARLIVLEHAAVNDAEDVRGAARSALRRACELLGDDLARNVTLAELAAVAGVSRHRLTRLFRAAYGLPPHRFVLAQRVRVARRLLERGVAPGDAAAHAGFFDQSHLHRHFTRTLGMTPGAYAAALRSDVQDACAQPS